MSHDGSIRSDRQAVPSVLGDLDNPIERALEPGMSSTPHHFINTQQRVNRRDNTPDTIIQIEDSKEDEKVTSNERVIHIVTKCAQNSNLNDWGFKYDGKWCVREFFTRVIENKVARNISDETLLLRFHELLIDTPLLFYRIIRERVLTLDQLKREFLKKFDLMDFDFKTEQLLRDAKQQLGQPVMEFVIDVQSLNAKLTNPIPDEQLLNIIKYNLNDLYAPCLSVCHINSVDSLVEICRNFESFTLNKDASVPSTTKYTNLKPKPIAMVASKQAINICAKCGETGHDYRSCRNIPGKICFKCRAHGVTARECTTCNLKVTQQKN